MERVTVSEAAKRLGITPNAVRQRVSRGKMPSDKDDDGRVFVYLDPSEQAHHRGGDELVQELRSRVTYLERELRVREEEARRKDHLLAKALERIPPQLEAPSDVFSEAPERPPEAQRSRSGGADRARRRKPFWAFWMRD